ncbi:glycoside hydrolase family 2 TIM barrel-domain containing protein [Streptomyces mirabilis]|uniref:glycoside hydrolase family 2 TIM barrel-domain containing protein n=1 Tax=Streptomyces mirabilis TaxID=68239 RepID=UPI00369FBDDC
MLRDRNHPSVVIWSLGNEITDRTNGQRGAPLADRVRSLHRTRPITLGGGSTFTADDPSWSYVDVGDAHQDTKFVNDHTWAVGNWVSAADRPARTAQPLAGGRVRRQPGGDAGGTSGAARDRASGRLVGLLRRVGELDLGRRARPRR